MDSDSKFWVCIWSVVAIAIVSLVSIVNYHFQDTNEKIRTAATCEAAVLIQGGQTVDTRLLLCAVGNKLKETQK